MEEQLENMEQGLAESVSVIEQAVDRLIESLASFMEKETDIGAQINEAATAHSAQATVFGQCPLCKKGSLYGQVADYKKTLCRMFELCWAGCKAIAPLPQKGSIRTTDKMCSACSWPVVKVVFARGIKHWRICINTHCPSKKQGTL